MPKQSDIDLVKAAAWAWYQHSSSSDGKATAIREFNAVRSQRVPGPTRYKLEAMRNNNNSTGTEGLIRSSLLDPYEIESISKRLDQLIGLSGIKLNRELLRMNEDVDDHPEKKRSSMSLKGFLQRRAVVCGRNHDVEETALRPKIHMAAANRVNGKPRAW
ncbi:hypothetical protein F3Y22_tig00111398pilonHSYRG00460 [Hibiscus syriacus]|uniref:Uncharacterized protein n=1 Tax=Hibiscus syriacus TaxID=106335 RepID=A0A6A2YHH3_HIBSY|nr:uncharacterized protein LOC120161214 [Hibiscus syriacus]KAE8679756.1 hypothetical protein F3Y22_tig00111398pilonHSYRG00460 [Hibiscus syriacus]